nr:uncharacterized protein LOC127493730 [Oryctolagus cuniculus]
MGNCLGKCGHGRNQVLPVSGDVEASTETVPQVPEPRPQPDPEPALVPEPAPASALIPNLLEKPRRRGRLLQFCTRLCLLSCCNQPPPPPPCTPKTPARAIETQDKEGEEEEPQEEAMDPSEPYWQDIEAARSLEAEDDPSNREPTPGTLGGHLQPGDPQEHGQGTGPEDPIAGLLPLPGPSDTEGPAFGRRPENNCGEEEFNIISLLPFQEDAVSSSDSEWSVLESGVTSVSEDLSCAWGEFRREEAMADLDDGPFGIMGVDQLHKSHWVNNLPDEVENSSSTSQVWSLFSSLGPSDSDTTEDGDDEEDQEAKDAEVDIISIFRLNDEQLGSLEAQEQFPSTAGIPGTATLRGFEGPQSSQSLPSPHAGSGETVKERETGQQQLGQVLWGPEDLPGALPTSLPPCLPQPPSREGPQE